jgi:magnesium-protoporphyrin IX monomethyl ester (oxidative) cyclase
VKGRNPGLLVVAGGAEPTANFEGILRESAVDVCVLGEGEQTFLELVRAMERGSGLEDVAGLALRSPEGSARLTAKRDFIADLDDIPLPAWDLVDFGRYPGMHISRAAPQTHMLVSRGCPFDCNFCANPVWKYNKPWVRMRSPANVAEEVRLLYDRGVREIYLSSDEFNVSEQWGVDVCRAIGELDCPDLYFQCNLRADKVSPRLAEAFAAINLWLVHLGIESGNQRTLDGIGKKVTLEQIERAARLLRGQGLKIFGFVMLYHAWEEEGELHWEDSRMVDNTLRFCKKLLQEGLIQYMSWQVATPMPGSRLYGLAQRHGLLPERRMEGVWARNLLLPGVSQKELKAKLRRGLILKNWYLLKNGNLRLAHLDRVWRNLKALAGRAG